MTPVMLDCNQKYQYELILNILAVHVNDAELNTDVHLFIVSIHLYISAERVWKQRHPSDRARTQGFQTLFSKYHFLVKGTRVP